MQEKAQMKREKATPLLSCKVQYRDDNITVVGELIQRLFSIALVALSYPQKEKAAP